MEKSYLKILVSEHNNYIRVRVVNGEELVYDKSTGVHRKELAFAFEAEIIPLRNMLENLGFELTEEWLNE